MNVFAGVAIAFVLGFGLAGYALGHSEAPGRADAELAEREARREAFDRARRAAFADSRKDAYQAARAEGENSGRRRGESAGRLAGMKAAQVKLDRQAAAEAATPPLEYTDALPNGEPGYLLPEEDRSLSCVGIDASTGECIGD